MALFRLYWLFRLWLPVPLRLLPLLLFGLPWLSVAPGLVALGALLLMPTVLSIVMISRKRISCPSRLLMPLILLSLVVRLPCVSVRPLWVSLITYICHLILRALVLFLIVCMLFWLKLLTTQFHLRRCCLVILYKIIIFLQLFIRSVFGLFMI